MQQLSADTLLQNGKYKIIKVLGQGGFGITYQGYNTEFEEDVAIKEFFIRGVSERDDDTNMVSVSNADNNQQFEEQLNKFKKEARRLRKLKNRHIVDVYDLFEENGTAYYVMELLTGKSLSDKMKEMNRPFTETEVGLILAQVLDALVSVHQQNIWHLDLKPGNLMMDDKGFVTLIDFGASKQINNSGNMTTSTAMCYTPGFAPNEQVGQMYDRFGPWTDLYALGATLYKLLTRNNPPMSIDIEEDGEDAFDFTVSVSPQMKKLILWLMQPRRKERPQSVEEVLKWLDYNPVEGSKESVSTIDNLDDNTVILKKTSNKVENSDLEQTEYSNIASTLEKDKSEVIEGQSDSNASEEEFTRLVIVSDGKEKADSNIKLEYEKLQFVNRFIDIGDYIFSDGSYSPNSEDGKRSNLKVVGVLLSKYTGDHGLLVTSEVDKAVKDINGISLKWHEATIVDWQKIIENLGHSKLYFENGDYHYYANTVKESLRKFDFVFDKYITPKGNGQCYVIDLLKGIISKEDTVAGLHRLYVTEF